MPFLYLLGIDVSVSGFKRLFVGDHGSFGACPRFCILGQSHLKALSRALPRGR